MELDDALDRISQIHAHVARGEVFRGYRALPTALTGLIAVCAAALQEQIVPAADARDFVSFWVVAAGIAGAIAAFDLALQCRLRTTVELRRRTWPVIAQYVPTVAVGAALAVALCSTAHAALLPALWAIVHGLGIFASRPFLPRAVGWVALWFVAAGTWLTTTADYTVTPDPWTMGIVFGLGQGALAIVLHCNLERRSGPVQDAHTVGGPR